MPTLYCFDLDGTLVRSFMREGGSGSHRDYDLIEPLPGRLHRVETLAHQPGAKFALVTNQGGVAFGYQSPGQVYRKIGGIVAAFSCFYARPLSIHIAFHHPRAKLDEWRCEECDEYRKPGPGMLREAMGRHGVPTEQTIFVGDMDSDEQAARAAGVTYHYAEDFFDER
jgi:D-glycero-D-manno-heptose 1,7-bisphosphate phosphatase